MQNLAKTILLGLLALTSSGVAGHVLAADNSIPEIRPFYMDDNGIINTPARELLEEKGYKYQGGKYLDKFTEIEGKETLAHYFIKNNTDFIGLFTLQSNKPYGFLFVKGEKKGTYYDLDGDGICEISQLQNNKKTNTSSPQKVLHIPTEKQKIIQSSKIDPPFQLGTITLPTKPNSSDITEPAMAKLEKLASCLVSHPDTRVRVAGYISSLTNSTENIRLSEKRAEAVKTLLLKQGVANHQIDVKGMGNQNPIGDNNTWEGRKKNRRVEITLLNQ